eukprot:CFRG2565T1
MGDGRVNFGKASPTYQAGYMIDADSDSDDENVDLSTIPDDLLDMTEEEFEAELRKKFASEMNSLHKDLENSPIPVEAFEQMPEYHGKGHSETSSRGSAHENVKVGVSQSAMVKSNVKFEDVTEMEVDTSASAQPLSHIHDAIPNHTQQETRNESSGGVGTSGTVYDDVYYDSDSSANDEEAEKVLTECGLKKGKEELSANVYGSGKRTKDTKEKERIVVDDESMFYDPDEDDNNQSWINKHRAKVSAKLNEEDDPERKVSNDRKNARPMFESDGILSCPCCMTMLCLDSQRHEKYTQQYRAMFVMNCKVISDQMLTQKSTENLKNIDTTTYNPVRCEHCSTEVAVVDPDEVYHFFNVLVSEP